MADAGRAHDFTVERPVALRLDREHGVYVYQVRSSRDIQDRAGETRVFIDADSGEPRGLSLPTGQYTGNTVTAWLFALHMGNVFGLPYRIFVCLLGLAIVMLSVTGVVNLVAKTPGRQTAANPATLGHIPQIWFIAGSGAHAADRPLPP